jgi:hypothetical protein
LNGLSVKFESHEKSLLINTNDDIRTTSDSLQAPDNGKSDDWRRVNDSMNHVSTKLEDDKKSLRTMAPDLIAICSDKEPSFERK